MWRQSKHVAIKLKNLLKMMLVQEEGLTFKMMDVGSQSTKVKERLLLLMRQWMHGTLKTSILIMLPGFQQLVKNKKLLNLSTSLANKPQR